MAFIEYGKCHRCGGTFQLKKNGALRVHGASERGEQRGMNCHGSGSFPSVQQYGARWATGIVFSYRTRKDAERAIQENPTSSGVLVVHEGVPGTPSDEWTDWVEVAN
jgi:hypothetical protein